MIKKLKYAIITLVMICTQNVFSQTKTIQGVVSDNTGSPLPGANVIIEGTQNGTSTGFDGRYTLKNVSTGSKIIYSFLGMISQTIKVEEQTKINVTLSESAESIKEIVVVGYGYQKKTNVTGAVSTVGAKEIGALPVANAAQALQGRAAGITVVNSGTPGTDPVVLIRGLGTFGSNSPLYVIDGVITGSLSGISPSDIENISVLKDASTSAIYGARGSSGVVMVTTKKGKKGKGELNFNTYTGVNYFNKRYDVLNTVQYLKYAAEGYNVTSINRPVEIFKNNVNYQDEIFTKGIIKDYNLNYSSGNEKGTQRFSLEYLDQEGVIINTGFERYSVRANMAYQFGKLSIGNSLSLAFSKQSPELNGGGRSLIEHAIKAAPYLPVFNPENLGGFQGPTSSVDGQDAENPVRIQTLGNAANKSLGIIGNIFAELEIAKGLKFKSLLGIDYFTNNFKRFVPSYREDNIPGVSTNAQNFALIVKNSNFGQAILLNNSLTYKTTIAEKHNIEVLALIEKVENKFEFINVNSRNTITDEVENLTNNVPSIGNGTSKTNRLGYLGRLNYNYEDRYIVALSLRRDASSRFGKNFRWANFPSVALGWNIAKEKFMGETSFSDLKIRGSYGITGNDQISDYRYSASLIGGFFYPINGTAVEGTSLGTLPNPNLKWEEKTIKNIGLDIGLFNNRVTATLEVFNNTSDDLLVFSPLSPSLGSPDGGQFANVGSVETKGAEFNLGYNDNNGNFRWSANFNIGSSKNKVLRLADGVTSITPTSNFKNNGDISRIVVGEPAYHYYGLVTDGIYQNQAEVNAVLYADPGQVIVKPGDIRFKDLNGDGRITADDRANIGNPYPDFTYGLNLSVTYQNFDFNLFMTGVQGIDVFNNNIYDLEGQTRLFNSGTSVLDRAIVQNGVVVNSSATVPRANGAPQNTAISDRFVEDGSYARLKNISIGYTIPNKAFNNYFSKFRVYASGQNMITITKYSGLDPELGGINRLTGDPNSSNQEAGIDRGNYPQPKSLLIGIEVTF
jgi:TonB-dependent starch-binding outer membrane protein SusC